jgi:hypothetical protein
LEKVPLVVNPAQRISLKRIGELWFKNSS